jgi:hypothetical protein
MAGATRYNVLAAKSSESVQQFLFSECFAKCRTDLRGLWEYSLIEPSSALTRREGSVLMPDEPKFVPVNLATMKPISREFPVYLVNESELDQLSSSYNSVHFGLFGVAFGAFVSVGITWIAEATANPTPLSTRATALFFSATAISFLFSIFCGFAALQAFGSCTTLIDRIKKPPGSRA